jgi:probable selenate reductase FAD-binding subunit
MVNAYYRPKNLQEALEFLSKEPGAEILSGGTYLLTSQFAKKPITAVAVSGLLPSAIERRGNVFILGAGATFQEAADSGILPRALEDAILGMTDRNIRNRATIGGNLGADKSCSSLIPFFLAAEARYSRVSAPAISAEAWEETPREERGIVAAVEFEVPRARRFAFARYARTSCDVAVLTCAAAADFKDGAIHGLKIAMGGLSPRARRFPELERLFEGSPLPAAAAIEEALRPLFSPRSDPRGSAEFKRARAAALLADVLASLAAQEEA